VVEECLGRKYFLQRRLQRTTPPAPMARAWKRKDSFPAETLNYCAVGVKLKVIGYVPETNVPIWPNTSIQLRNHET